MSDIGREIARSMRVQWTHSRSQAAEAGLRVRRRRRAIARVTLVASATAIAALAWAVVPRYLASETPAIASQPPLPAPAHGDDVAAPTPAPAPQLAQVVPPVTPAPQVALPTPAVTPAKKAAPAKQHVVIAPDGWRELAHQGEFDRAYEALDDVRDEAEELLLAADVKRLSHHPAEAIAPLRQILADHASDPRAPLAAFTLGRVLLEELSRPAEAAEAFARADELAPTGQLAEDAVARRVEALARAGDREGAKRAAEQYVARFPSGRKLRSVRRLSGLE